MDSYRLYRANEDLGLLTFDRSDWPWLMGSFVATGQFSAVKELFDRLFAAANGGGGNFMAIWSEIAEPGIYL